MKNLAIRYAVIWSYLPKRSNKPTLISLSASTSHCAFRIFFDISPSSAFVIVFTVSILSLWLGWNGITLYLAKLFHREERNCKMPLKEIASYLLDSKVLNLRQVSNIFDILISCSPMLVHLLLFLFYLKVYVECGCNFTTAVSILK